MPLSSNKTKFVPKSGAVLSREVAQEKVLDYVPVRLDLGTPQQALAYLDEKKRGSDFQMGEAIRVQTGVDKIERVADEDKIEVAALEKLKEIQESAYEQAYNLGLEKGHKEAFAKTDAIIQEKLKSIDDLVNSLKGIKKDLCSMNEAHLITLTFQMATRLAKAQLVENNEAMLQILRDAVSIAQEEEDITALISPSQFDFFDQLKNETGREVEFVKKIRFEPSEDVQEGGCIIETNYGEVDARIEQRVEQLWTVLSENMPKVKDRVES